ncbi:MAG: hypothetical protein HDR08_12830 [Lachnospiraceae bacterium]|nr:hypothetical protein [Lachnospiraceae bacterium]
MSRSYKRIPCCKDYSRGMKKHANRYVRRNYVNRNDVVLPSGAAYKKLFCSWDICDYKFLYSFSAYKEEYKIYNHRSTNPGIRPDRELYRKWYRLYKMK